MACFRNRKVVAALRSRIWHDVKADVGRAIIARLIRWILERSRIMTNVAQSSIVDVNPQSQEKPDVTGPAIAASIFPYEPEIVSGTWMTAQDICRFFRVGKRTFYRWRHTAVFPKPDLQLGKVHRWRRQAVETWAATIMDQGQCLDGKEI